MRRESRGDDKPVSGANDCDLVSLFSHPIVVHTQKSRGHIGQVGGKWSKMGPVWAKNREHEGRERRARANRWSGQMENYPHIGRLREVGNIDRACASGFVWEDEVGSSPATRHISVHVTSLGCSSGNHQWFCRFYLAENDAQRWEVLHRLPLLVKTTPDMTQQNGSRARQVRIAWC